MLILHAIASLDPVAGGPPQVAYRLAAAQAALGHEVHLVTYGGDSAARDRVSKALAAVPASGRVVLHELPPPSVAERILARSARALFRKRLPGLDFLHLHGVWEALIRVGAAEARRQRKPYAVTPHGMLDPWSLAQRKWKKRLALATGYREMLDGAAFLHCLNDDETRLLAPLGLTCATRTIPNGIFPEELAGLPPKGRFRQMHPELGDARYLLFLSRLHYKKGLDLLARAFAILARKVPDLRLVVAGPDGGARADFEAEIARAGLTGRTHVLGLLHGDDKLGAFVDATAFCLPSRQEGFSVAVLEAMACGAPVVITQNCHFPEVASSSAGYVVPLESAAVADALLSVISDPVKAQRMGKAGQDLVRTHYTWPVIAHLFVDAYGEVIASAPGPSGNQVRVGRA